MITLKSLNHRYLTENIIRSLTQNRIITLIDFLQEDAEKLIKVTNLGFLEVLDIRNNIYDKYSAPLINGLNLYNQTLESKKFISTGIENLDLALDGGIPVGYISELCGLAGSGKSQLCLQVAINHVKNSDCSVLYIDTKGDFSAIQIQKCLEYSGMSFKDMAVIMLKIKVVYIWNMCELIDLMSKIKSRYIDIDKLSLIIIDSLPCLMFQHFGDDCKIGFTFLNTFVNDCRCLCKENKISIICVNLQTRWVHQNSPDNDSKTDEQETSLDTKKYQETRNRCLGKYWQHIPALVIIVEKLQEVKPHPCLLLNVSIFKLNMSHILKKCLITLNIVGKITME